LVTASRGSGATMALIPVSFSISMSSPLKSAPPPARYIPLSYISPDSSGGVFSSVFFIAEIIAYTCSRHAFTISFWVIHAFLGIPLDTSLPVEVLVQLWL
jgi:hypothetical protein